MGLHNLLPQNGEAPPCPHSRKFSQILGTQPHECTEQPQAFPPPYENSESPAFWDGEQAIRASVGSFRCRAVPSYLSNPRTSSIPMINLYSSYIRAQHSRTLPCTPLILNALCPHASTFPSGKKSALCSSQVPLSLQCLSGNFTTEALPGWKPFLPSLHYRICKVAGRVQVFLLPWAGKSCGEEPFLNLTSYIQPRDLYFNSTTWRGQYPYSVSFLSPAFLCFFSSFTSSAWPCQPFDG